MRVTHAGSQCDSCGSQVLGLAQDAANQRADSEDTLVECVKIRCCCCCLLLLLL